MSIMLHCFKFAKFLDYAAFYMEAMQTCKKKVFERSLPAERYKENSSCPRACPNAIHSS